MRIFSTLCCGALAFCLHAQTTFMRTIGLPFGVIVTGSDATLDDGLILSGYHRISYQEYHGVLMRLDALGNTAWLQKNDAVSLVYNSNWEMINYRGVVQLLDSSFIAVGTNTDTVSWPVNTPASLVVHLREDGDTLRGAYYPYSPIHSSSHDDVFLLANGTPVARGQYRTLNLGHGKLGKLDSVTLDMGVFATPATNGDNMITSAAPCPNGGAAGVVLRTGFPSTISLFKVDDGMNLEWSWNYASALSDVDGGFVTVAPDSMIYHASGSGPFIVSQVSPTGAPLWSVSLTVPGAATLNAIATDSTNAVLVAGHTVLGADTSVVWLSKFDPFGNLQWTRRYGVPGDELVLRRLEPTTVQDGFWLVAQKTDSTTVVIRTDADGLLGNCLFPAMSATTSPTTLVATDTMAFYLNGVGNGPSINILPEQQYASNTFSCISGAGPFSASGHIFSDTDMDGMLDSGEPAFPWTSVSVSPGIGTLFSGSNGVYDFVTNTIGTYAITAPSPAPWWTITTDSTSFNPTFTPTDTLFEDLDFGFAPAFDTTIVEGALISQQAGCFGAFGNGIRLTNLGSNTPSGIVAMAMDTGLYMISASPSPDSLVGSTAYWSYAPMSYYATWDVDILFQDNGWLQQGDTVVNSINVYADDGFGNLVLEDSATVEPLVTCSYDPNDKTVSPIGGGTQGGIPPVTDWLTYTIRFQNTGTDTAYTVVIEDQLDADLQWSTLQFLGASHAMTGLSIGPYGRAEFRFENILLPDSNANELESHGFVTYRIAPQPGLPHLTTIVNNAGLFFDQNLPVITNTTLNTIVDCGQVTWVADIEYFVGGYMFATFYDAGVTYQWYLNGSPIPGADQGAYLPQTDGDYTVTITDEYGCTQLSPVEQIIALAVQPLGGLAMLARPNPFSDATVLSFNEPVYTDTRIELIDIHGRVVRTLQGNSTREVTIERGTLQSGLYMVRVMDAQGQRAAVRVVVQ